MNIKYVAIIAGILLGIFAVRFVRADEVSTEAPVTVTVTETGVSVSAAPTTSSPSLATKIAEAERKVQARQMEAARRAGLSFFEARGEDLGKVWGATKWGACQAARGVANADGYIGAAVAVPAGYIAGSAFSAAESCRTSAASIR